MLATASRKQVTPTHVFLIFGSILFFFPLLQLSLTTSHHKVIPPWRAGCCLKDVKYETSPEQFYPIYAMGDHSGPVRGNFDNLFADTMHWRHMCPRWFEGIPGEFQFTSQFGQDFWVFNNIFLHYPPGYRGVYVDSAAFHPIKESNTFFFDKCLNWTGLCVEPQPANYAQFLGRRSCALIPFAVSDHREVVEFLTFKGDWAGSSGVGKVRDAEENPVFLKTMELADSKSLSSIEVTTFSLQDIFDHFSISHVDYLSLDVEGNELKAVKAIDFSRTAIDVITIENSPAGSEAAKFLIEKRGYEPILGEVYNTIALVDHILIAPGFAGFSCNHELQKPDSFRMCSGDKYDGEDLNVRHAKYKLCKKE